MVFFRVLVSMMVLIVYGRFGILILGVLVFIRGSLNYVFLLLSKLILRKFFLFLWRISVFLFFVSLRIFRKCFRLKVIVFLFLMEYLEKSIFGRLRLMRMILFGFIVCIWIFFMLIWNIVLLKNFLSVVIRFLNFLVELNIILKVMLLFFWKKMKRRVCCIYLGIFLCCWWRC